jgi:hypothetical protein
MLWLDGVWPRDEDASDPGNTRGDCPADSGNPADVIAEHGDAYVESASLFVKKSERLTNLLLAAMSAGPTSATAPSVPPPACKRPIRRRLPRRRGKGQREAMGASTGRLGLVGGRSWFIGFGSLLVHIRACPCLILAVHIFRSADKR